MKALKQLTITMLAGLALAGCTVGPNPNVSKPFTMPDGTVVQPPPGGWPSYDKGGESGGGGGRS